MSENAIVLATGKKGTGKTTRLRQLAGDARRTIIADPEGKWPLAGDLEARGATALFDLLTSIKATDPGTRFRVVYRDDADVMADAAPAAAFAVRNVTLVVDELAWICNANWLPRPLTRVLQFGRERRINLLGTTRRPQEIHGFLYDQADYLYFFRMEPGLGLERVRRFYPQLADDLPSLALHQFRTYGNPAVLRLIGREGA